jgi:hypothetical protein
LAGRNREHAVISVKFGLMCAPNEGIVGNDLRPQAVKNSLAYTLRRPGTDYVRRPRRVRAHPETRTRMPAILRLVAPPLGRVRSGRAV